RRHAGGGLVVLIHHDVQPELVRDHPLIVIAVEQVAGDFRVELAIGQVHAQRAVVIVPDREVRLLGELIDAHGQSPEARRAGRAFCRSASANASTRRANSSGCSTWGKWPARSMVSKRAPAMAAQ